MTSRCVCYYDAMMTHSFALGELVDDVFEDVASVDVVDYLPVLVVREDDVCLATMKQNVHNNILAIKITYFVARIL